MRQAMQNLPGETVVANVVFFAGEHCCGIAVDDVECVVDVVAIEPVPEAPAAVLGLVNFHGTVVPVVDLRRRFGATHCSEIECGQKLIIARAPTRLIALLADSVEGVEWISPECIRQVDDFVPGAARIKGSATREHGLIFIHSAELLLTQSEERCLDASLPRRDG